MNSAVLLTVAPQHRCGVGAGGGVCAAGAAAQLGSRQGCAAAVSCCGGQTAPPAVFLCPSLLPQALSPQHVCSVLDVMELMVDKNVRHLPVVSRRSCGAISRLSLCNSRPAAHVCLQGGLTIGSKVGTQPAARPASLLRMPPTAEHATRLLPDELRCLLGTLLLPQIDEGNMVGMISIKDVVHVMLKEHRWALYP